MQTRNYAALGNGLIWAHRRENGMGEMVDRLWPALSSSGVSWLGFYLWERRDELVLGPRRDKPACSPIGMHGACGRALLERAALVIGDVARLGAGYVACDPRDRSELVIPLIDDTDRCWGVFDADSFDLDSFSKRDALELNELLRAAGLTESESSDLKIVEI